MAVKSGDGVLCKACREALLRWADELSPLDRELSLLGTLCEVVGDDGVDGEALMALGAAIHRHRKRRILIDFAFLGRDLITLGVAELEEDDPTVQGELLRLSSGKSRRLL